jgi:hypothetical protein
MELTFACPSCSVVQSVSTFETETTVSCRSCHQVKELHREAFDAEGLRACPWCATEDLYIQKDFPQALGLLIVVVGFAISTVFWYYEMPIATFTVLILSALIDWVLYDRVPDVTICYRCLSQYRGLGRNPHGRFQPFDLAVGERYRQERLRVEELRRRQASADSPPPS